VARLAQLTVEQLIARRSTWTRWNVLAETARTCHGLRMAGPAERHGLHDRVAQAVLDRCVPLDPPELFTVPAAHRRPDGTSVFTRPGEEAFTDLRILQAEQRLIDATTDTAAPTAHEATARWIATSPQQLRRGGRPLRLAPDQIDAVIAIATSGRRLDVLVGPAGTGKTTTLRALRAAWETRFGQGSVIGLAPSANAAEELAAALRIPCENTAKWLHETTGPGAQQRAEALTGLAARRAGAAARGDLPALRRIDAAATALRSDQQRWSLRPGQLVMVDEASLAGTLALDTLAAQAADAGAKLLLVGDHRQLSSVDAGGAFGLLADRGHAHELRALWRFRHRWEADATRLLRHGDPAAVDRYAAHGRITDGLAEAMLEAAYTAWQDDQQAGRSAILVAADTATVDALNARAHADRVAAGLVAPVGVPAAEGVTIAAGDRVVTRLNARGLAVPGRGHVRNGDLWDVTATHPDGSVTVTPAGRYRRRHPDTPGPQLTLPAAYVRENVELGYATTGHRAQGVTVDRGHVLAAPGMPAGPGGPLARHHVDRGPRELVDVDGLRPNGTAAAAESVAHERVDPLLPHDGGRGGPPPAALRSASVSPAPPSWLNPMNPRPAAIKIIP
jgi:ATP-dependent exoDNAse (exonuclease V) alpha subunit